MIELTSGDEHKFSAYRADPSGTPRGAVVVLQDIYGVDAHIRKAADGFAEKGYVAIAPALFDRAKSNVSLGHDSAGVAEGTQLVQQLEVDAAFADIQKTVEAVSGAGKVAVVGYSWGGYLAYSAANRVPGLACAIGYYGPGTQHQIRGKVKIPTLLHFGESDTVIPFEEVVNFRWSRPDVCSYTYPSAGHDFNEEGTPGYNAHAAQSALERTLFWVSQYVEGQPPILLKNAGSYAQAKTEKKKKKKSSGNDMGPPDA